ncbi:hypothetical protein BGW36DRAFT_304216 [Talaromyces proteolyticus]|uniref:Arrestin-like N-terminal domain-containing protein n=1 Tax=Talaromyces proteolyticus TaxID=1131652 RepID=A0AAD4KHQ9_9EURO|nr:uncharacterized protein BGW36DRAFT_304216 [Talaromyces proteolyticus]KAH8692389.1 hypothetical protein BGW36DRAFT_304216 [Talaromyces proteolyticus]
MSSAVIQLDKPHSHFTNLDYITGRVVLQLSSDTSISAIHVKLEGESRTRLARPRDDRDREKRKNELEVHKILYKVNSVFPSPDIAQHSSPNAAFTFAPGVYQYPFQFKFPFNNACSDHNSMMTNISMIGLRVEMARDSFIHVKKTLPPSLNTFPGEAEIKYYVKVTVVRPQFFKENIRSIAGFNFLPIEPPRDGNPNEETYARRQQEFARNRPPMNPKTSGGLFRKKSTPIMAPISTEPPRRVSVDARLPNPAILTCNQPIPLRLLVTKQSPSTETIYLQLLQIELISYTHIRAHDLARTEPLSTLILSRSNMNMAIGRGTDPVGKEWKIDSSMWERLPLPSNIAPTFETCNISRAYELEVRVGLAYGAGGSMLSQVLVIPLRLAVKVYSGIRPPAALLEAMAADKKVKNSRPQRPPVAENDIPPPQPPRPQTTPGAAPAFDETGEEAPPSYEDAMAEHIDPIDGPRGEYQTPAPSQETSLQSNVGDIKTPVDSKRAQDDVYPASSLSRSSSESIDMLPQTPRSRRGSIADSLMWEDAVKSTTVGKPQQQNTIPEETHQQAQEDIQGFPIPSASTTAPRPARTFSTGVPNRRPVPGTSQKDPS